MINLLELLNAKIEWVRGKSDKKFFVASYKGIDLLLRMNNFPEEPMYTLFWIEESSDFDDKPDSWKINY
ncbi:MAG: hypothetical protein JKY48_06340 [Flavobacteriales bacterium]|nr:hypothetical protein [Flavobacteriales bacterium]